MSKKLCHNFLSPEGCKHGQDCRYSHEAQEGEATEEKHHSSGSKAKKHGSSGTEEEEEGGPNRAAVEFCIEVVSPVSGIVSAEIDVKKASPTLISALTRLPDSTVAQLKKQPEARRTLACFDYHGVIDVVAETEPAANISSELLPICVVSYVGAFGKIRDETRASIQRRIANGQVALGIMVFKKLRFPFPEINVEPFFLASKRHAVELLLKNNSDCVSNVLFVDDGKDNVETVKSLGDARVSSVLFSGKNVKELAEFTDRSYGQFMSARKRQLTEKEESK